MRVGDLIALRELPKVVQLEAVMRERQEALPHRTLTPSLESLISTYLIVEGANRVAFESIIRSLSLLSSHGEGFIISGAYGTGKTHLLALVGLLCESKTARDLFFSLHPEYSGFRSGLESKNLLVVYISLDAYSGRRAHLEDVLWLETVQELNQQKSQIPNPNSQFPNPKSQFPIPNSQIPNSKFQIPNSKSQIPNPKSQIPNPNSQFLLPEQMPPSRAEAFLALQKAIAESGFDGIIWLIDELAMFLAAKEPRDLQNDASFLQFLGQRTQLSPLWVVATIQKTLEDIGEIEPYSLSQIKDRYQTRHSLSFAHARQLVSRNLIVKNDEGAFEEKMRELHRNLLERLPMLSFGFQEICECYPLHPTTIDCLQRCTAQFFSRTRSIVDFVQEQVKPMLSANFQTLITPDAILDHFLPDMLNHPELRVYAQTVLPYFEQNAARLFPQNPQQVLPVIKALIIFKVAGKEVNVRELANALVFETNSGYSQVLALLEALRTKGNYISCLRRESEFGDVYAIDLGATLNEMLNRRLNAVMASLSENDARILGYAWECCRTEEFELPPLASPRTVEVEWQNTERNAAVLCVDLRRLTAPQLINAIELLSNPQSTEDLQLFIGTPFEVEEQKRHIEALLSGLRRAPSLLPPSPNGRGAGGEGLERWRHGVCALLARPLSEAERFRLRENAAAHLLANDPTLRDSEDGLKILRRLKEDAPLRAQESQRILQNAFTQGRLIFAGGEIEVSQLSAISRQPSAFHDLVHAAASTVLPLVFTSFADVAPKEHFAGGRLANQLAQLLLTGNLSDVTDPTLWRLLRTVAVPLGICRLEGDEVSLCPPKPGISQLVHELMGSSPVSYTRFEAALAKSPYGLTPPLTQLLAAALLSLGELSAQDRAKLPLPAHRLTAPLSRSVAFLTMPALVSDDVWQKLLSIFQALSLTAIEEQPSASAQQRAWRALMRFKEEQRAAFEETRARLFQLLTSLNQRESHWKDALETLSLVNRLLTSVDEEAAAFHGLNRFVVSLEEASLTPQSLKQAWNDFSALRSFLTGRADSLVAAFYYLSQSSLSLPEGALSEKRAKLLEQIGEGEAVIDSWQSFEDGWLSFLDEYATAYLAHHEQVHSAYAFQPYEALRRSETYRLMEQLVGLRVRAFPQLLQAGQLLAQALSQQCPQKGDELRLALRASPVCLRCQVKLGESLSLLPPNEVASALSNAVNACKAFLGSERVRAAVGRYAKAMPPSAVRRQLEQLGSLSADDEDSQWLAVLSTETISHINAALSPAAPVIKDLQSLCERLEGKVLTKSDAVKEFVSWLDSESPLKPRERIKFVRASSESHESGSGTLTDI